MKKIVFGFCLLLGGAVNAAPITYSFSATAGGGLPSPSLFGVDDIVVGEFTYENDNNLINTFDDGTLGYVGNLSNLTGSVAGMNFSDPIGSTAVANDVNSPRFINGVEVDAIVLSWEPLLIGTPPLDPVQGSEASNLNFSGFSLLGHTLVNMRMFWLQPLGGISDFLDDALLPTELPPTIGGVLALDFMDQNGDIVHNFFGNLTVTQVPSSVSEPASFALMLLGLVFTGFLSRKRKSH